MSTKSSKTPRQKSASSTTGNTTASLQVSLPQMLDLALGTPEVGAVNFNILHNFLHVVLHQINLRTTKVEYRGEDAKRIKTMVTSLKDEPSLHLHEYSILDNSGRVKQRIHSDQNLTVNVDIYTDANPSGKISRGSVSARETRSKDATDIEVNRKKVKGVKQQITGGVEGELESVIFVESVVDGVTPTALNFNKLEYSVQKLQQQFQVLEELATNSEIINKVKGNSVDPLKDIWQFININKRLDASEQGISKLTSMLQDIIRGDKEDSENGADLKTQLTEIDRRLSNQESLLEDKNSADRQSHSKQSEKLTDESEKTERDTTKEVETVIENLNETNPYNQILANVNNLKNDLNQVRNDIAELRSKFKNSKPNPKVDGEIEKVISEPSTKIIESENKNQSNSSILSREENNDSESREKHEEETLEKQKPDPREKSENSSTIADEVPIHEKLELRLKNVETVCDTALKELNTRIENIEKSTGMISLVNNASTDKETNINELDTKIKKIEEEMKKLIQTDKIREDKEITISTNVLQEQIEVLKVMKVDKEHFQDALVNKAVTRDDLTRGLEEALDKLNQQESIWQRALDEIQKEIECKLDKEEISPFKESVDDKFHRLQEKMKILLEMKEPNEAAATKKMLRDVQCLSCDRDVVMRMHDNNPMYLSSFKKMQLRATQPKKLSPQRKDMLYLEAALKEERKSKFKNSNLPRNFSNRYCGGSHTIISPQQKIMRNGNFINQWGSQVFELPAGNIKGSDGKTYYSRPVINGNNQIEQKICEPCDNKCYSKPPSKENLISQPKEQSNSKNGSYVSAFEENVEDKVFVESHENLYEHSNYEDEMTLVKDPPPPPSSPLQEKLWENEQLVDINEEPLRNSRTNLEESKSIEPIAFEGENYFDEDEN